MILESKQKIKKFIYDDNFFDWLRSIDELDKYEAALDISTDYVSDQGHMLEASAYIDELKTKFINR